MGYLKNKVVYLCGPITNVSDDGTTWRNYLTPILETKFGIIVDDPCKKTIDGVGEIGADKLYFKKLIKERQFERVKKEFYKIIRKDLKSVDKSDFLIFYHEPKIATVGTYHEVVNAVNSKKPVLLMCEEQNLDNLNPWLLTLIKSQWLFTNWDDMLLYLEQIDNERLDTSHWW
jgi:nucleoside 2-deoxyribosyltransferase